MDHPYVNIHTHRRTGEGIEITNYELRITGEKNYSPTKIITNLNPKPPFSVGIHPWQAGEVDLETALREVETAPASAIGEIGLDFAVPGDHGEQKMVFAAQLRIAVERGLPVVLHCVRAFEPAMEILAGFRLPAVIFHGFIGSPEQAARAVKRGYYLSFGERAFDSPKTVEALRGIPLENLFLESDDSPVSISGIYSRAAEIISIPVPQLKKIIYNNYSDCFGCASQ